MAKLTTKARNAIPSKSFALPGRRYPIEDRSHAQNALARVSQFGTSAEKSKVRSAVSHAYPGMMSGAHTCTVPGCGKKHAEHRMPAHG